MRFELLTAAAAAFAFSLAGAARAVVVIDYVPVGNPGNAGDVQSQGTFGSVPTAYAVGRTEVTNAQYAEFLNAKATADPLGLYNANMASDARGGIVRSGASGSFTYAVKTGRANNPVVYVSWYDSVRFANWLNNGQGAGGTEAGAYTLTGNTAAPNNGNSVARAAGATVFLPSENEWYKAAYFDPAKPGGAGYWDYPTRTDAVPFSDQPPGTGAPAASNAGNFIKDDGIANGYDDGFAVTGSTAFVAAQNYPTDAGAYPSALSGYATLDQGGNVFEWNDTLIGGSSRGVRGSSRGNFADDLAASSRLGIGPTGELENRGFRVASIPEPAGTSVMLLAVTALALRRRRV